MRKKKKSKILIILIIIVVLVLAGKACGGSKDTDTSVDDSAVTNQEVSDSDAADSDDAESSEDASEPESADDKSSDSDDESSESSVISPEFKKTMDDYEAWFDHYCEVMKKYEDNPSDLEVLSEMTDLLAEESKMLEQLENMDESEMNTAEYAYYIEVTARIEKKLLEVSG